MSAGRAACLRAAAARKREQATSRARAALRELDERGEVITFQSVARRAGVSRQWLYQQPELWAEIERLRAIQHTRPRSVPAAERASEASLRQRVATLSEDNRRLRAENQALKSELAVAYGERRSAATSASSIATARSSTPREPDPGPSRDGCSEPASSIGLG